MRPRDAMGDLKKHDDYTNQLLVPEFRKILPRSHSTTGQAGRSAPRAEMKPRMRHDPLGHRPARRI